MRTILNANRKRLRHVVRAVAWQRGNEKSVFFTRPWDRELHDPEPTKALTGWLNGKTFTWTPLYRVNVYPKGELK